MAYYKVGSDGKAPAGIAANNYVVTGGGTYSIDGLDEAGNYKKTMYDPNLTTHNFQGQYANGDNPNISPAQQNAQAESPASSLWGQNGQAAPTSPGLYSGAVAANGSVGVSNKGQGTLSMDPNTGRIIRTMPDGRSWYVDPTDAKYAELYQEYMGTSQGAQMAAANSQAANIAGINNAINALNGISTPAYVAPNTGAQQAKLDNYLNQLDNLQYTPVNMQDYLGGVGDLDSYINDALRILEPKYAAEYDKARIAAEQNLDRAGLYNSLYGQGLLTQEQNAVSQALMAEAGTLGKDMRDRAYDEAFQRYQAAVNENQYGSTFRQTNLTEGGKMMMDYIGLLDNEAKMQNDYNLQAQLNQIQQYTAAVDAYAQSGKLTQYQYENMMTMAEIELSKIEGQLKQAQITNTNADTEKIKAQTQAIMAELAGFSGASSGYGYGGGYGYSGYGGGGGDYYGDDGGGDPVYTPNASNASRPSGALSAHDVNYAIDTALANGDKTSAWTALNNGKNGLTDKQLQDATTKIKTADTHHSGKFDDKVKPNYSTKGVGFNG